MEYGVKAERTAVPADRAERVPIGELAKIQGEQIREILGVIERMSVFMYGEGIPATEKNEVTCFEDIMRENTHLIGHALEQLCKVVDLMNR